MRASWTEMVLFVQVALVGLMMGLLLLAGVVAQAGIVAGRGSIAYVSEQDGNPEIYLLDIDRAYLRRLTRHAAADRRPAWSPDGRAISFYSNRHNGRWNIYLMQASGSRVRQITDTDGRDGNLAWSPDGRYVAFDSTRSGNLEIYVMEAACMDAPTTCAPRRLTNHAAADRYPTWSPDGRYLLFESVRYEYYDIFRIRADGRDLTRLTRNTIPDWGANWSPDGTQIAFASSRGASWDIYVIPAACEGLVGGCEGEARLLIEHPHDDSLPQWSPDGRYLLFESWIDDNFELFIAAADGSGLQRLTFNRADDTQAVWWP